MLVSAEQDPPSWVSPCSSSAQRVILTSMVGIANGVTGNQQVFRTSGTQVIAAGWAGWTGHQASMCTMNVII